MTTATSTTKPYLSADSTTYPLAHLDASGVGVGPFYRVDASCDQNGNMITPAQDGTDATGVTPPTGGVGIRGWLSGIYAKLSGSLAVTGTFWPTTQPISAASLPLPAGAAQDGADATGVQPPAGSVGIRGWLSGIYSLLGGSIKTIAAPYAYTPKSPGQHNLSLATVQSLTIPSGAAYATVQAFNGTIKYTTDGATTPTPNVGMTLTAPASVSLSGAATLANFRAISTSATLDVEYFS